jgi:hypothetical protein
MLRCTHRRTRAHACAWKHTLSRQRRRDTSHLCSGRTRGAFSIFAGVNVLFDESLGVSTELRTAYAVFIILSIFIAAVSFVYRILAARSVHQVRPATHAAPCAALAPAHHRAKPKHVRMGKPQRACVSVQAVTAFRRAAQPSEETDEAAAFMRKLQWELDKIARDLVTCGITCLTLFGEGDAASPQAESARECVCES